METLIRMKSSRKDAKTDGFSLRLCVSLVTHHTSVGMAQSIEIIPIIFP